ncbi:GAF domain-containing sensor histidine kinase [Flavimarina sp. Hel_I_48]|uniref:GAF domain-containing sensor histidine kinase n=1 Tax=Flavimarina sp. Hel_I_48 TaxID=1392488 RepID=UPI0004DFAF6E|nr:GAF domain-containing sensor histidine kinase [Flavimarina sp. Hel_I_48]
MIVTSDRSPELDRDINNIAGIKAIVPLLNVVCRTTGMGFAAVARVTDSKWITCLSQDEIGFGLTTGDELDLQTTLCNEIMQYPDPIIIEHVDEDEEYHDHHTPAKYGFQSYISYPIFRRDGHFFGTLCAIDPSPAKLKNRQTKELFELFAQLISYHLATVEDLEQLTTNLRNERTSGELRETFIAILAHDLRNPVGTTRMCADMLLQMESLSERGMKVAENIKSTSYRMQRLIDNLLSFAKGNLGDGINLNLSADMNLLRENISQVVNEIRTLDSNHTITTAIELDHLVICDATRIGQLLSNLLSNAVKHGENGGTIDLEINTKNGSLNFEVSNTGKEIEQHRLDQLFKPFIGQDSTYNRNGLGLGLYICLEIAKAHGGKIKVDTNSERTTFTFSMPLENKVLEKLD